MGQRKEYPPCSVLIWDCWQCGAVTGEAEGTDSEQASWTQCKVTNTALCTGISPRQRCSPASAPSSLHWQLLWSLKHVGSQREIQLRSLPSLDNSHTVTRNWLTSPLAKLRATDMCYKTCRSTSSSVKGCKNSLPNTRSPALRVQRGKNYWPYQTHPDLWL